jgi:cell division protein FtsI/penicillin-binding protein 2
MNSDRKANGIVTMTQALEKSLNTGMVYILNAIGKTKFFEYIHRFNFGKATGIEQIGEGQGFVSDNLNLPAHTVATMTFGQSISVTPIQMITAFSSIANNGIMVKPTLISELIDPNTGKSEKTKPVTVGRVMSEENAQKEKAMLRSVILKGHGKKAGVAGYKIGGKTGTAQVPRQDGKGYETNKNIGSFIGIGPLDNPRFVIMSKIDYPKGVQWAETTAAPVVGEMFDFLFKYYQIPPTEKVK